MCPSLELGFWLTHLCKEVNSPRVIQPGRQHEQQVVDEQGFVIQIELQGFVVELHIGNLQVGGQSQGQPCVLSPTTASDTAHSF